MKGETQAWLTKAREDLSASDLLLNADLTDSACYHCQQASEKFLKALFEECGERIPRSHDLDLLIRQLLSIMPVPEDVQAAATFLSGFEVAVRYPGTDTDFEDAQEAVKMARTITDWVAVNFRNDTDSPRL